MLARDRVAAENLTGVSDLTLQESSNEVHELESTQQDAAYKSLRDGRWSVLLLTRFFDEAQGNERSQETNLVGQYPRSLG